jgi:hypothetical protein
MSTARGPDVLPADGTADTNSSIWSEPARAQRSPSHSRHYLVARKGPSFRPTVGGGPFCLRSASRLHRSFLRMLLSLGLPSGAGEPPGALMRT